MLTVAIARMDAIIARVHHECLVEDRVTAHATHHLGCTLDPMHDGDCIVHRPRKPRYTIGGL